MLIHTSTDQQLDAVVVIGRFMLPHYVHLDLLIQALGRGKHVVVALGSAFHARTSKNCFLWGEREAMFRLCLTDEQNARVTFVPVRDYYNTSKWLAALERKVQSVVGDTRSIRVIGNFKDASSEYLRQLPWDVIETGKVAGVDSTTMRRILYESDDFDSARAVMAPFVPEPVLRYLRAWCQLPYLHELKKEYFKLKQEKLDHPQPYGVAADFIFEYGKYVLLIERLKYPGKGLFAWPGGFWEPERRETLRQCALREGVKEETGLGLLPATIDQAFQRAALFDAPDRSVRGPIVSMAHHYKMAGGDVMPELSPKDGEARPFFFETARFPELESQMYDDHYLMGQEFLGFELAD